MPKHPSHILELAHKGAAHRLEELRAEIRSLVKAFPDLAGRGRRRKVDISAEPAATVDPIRRRRRRMSPGCAQSGQCVDEEVLGGEATSQQDLNLLPRIRASGVEVYVAPTPCPRAHPACL